MLWTWNMIVMMTLPEARVPGWHCFDCLFCPLFVYRCNWSNRSSRIPRTLSTRWVHTDLTISFIFTSNPPLFNIWEELTSLYNVDALLSWLWYVPEFINALSNANISKKKSSGIANVLRYFNKNQTNHLCYHLSLKPNYAFLTIIELQKYSLFVDVIYSPADPYIWLCGSAGK